MARDDRDDRRLFGEDSLNLVEGCATAIRVGLAGLLRKQIVNPGLPRGSGFRLLRAPGIRGATAAQEIGVGGRIRLAEEPLREVQRVIIVTFRRAPQKLTDINRGYLHLDSQP